MEQDGTWGTIKVSCTVVRDFADMCFHSYPVYLKELRESSQDREPHSFRYLSVCPPTGCQLFRISSVLCVILGDKDGFVMKRTYLAFFFSDSKIPCSGNVSSLVLDCY